MESVSTRIDEETYETITTRADERGSSKAEVLRRLIQKGLEAEELEHEIERKDARINELVQALQAANRREEETTELVRYVDETRSAGVVQRAKWWLFGRDS